VPVFTAFEAKKGGFLRLARPYGTDLWDRPWRQSGRS